MVANLNIQRGIITQYVIPLHWREPVRKKEELPTLNPELGECRLVVEEGTIYFWDGNKWQPIRAQAVEDKYQVLVAPDDTVPGYLSDELIAGKGLMATIEGQDDLKLVLQIDENVVATKDWALNNFYTKDEIDSWNLIKNYTLEQDLNANNHSIYNVQILETHETAYRVDTEIAAKIEAIKDQTTGESYLAIVSPTRLYIDSPHIQTSPETVIGSPDQKVRAIYVQELHADNIYAEVAMPKTINVGSEEPIYVCQNTLTLLYTVKPDNPTGAIFYIDEIRIYCNSPQEYGAILYIEIDAYCEDGNEYVLGYDNIDPGTEKTIELKHVLKMIKGNTRIKEIRIYGMVSRALQPPDCPYIKVLDVTGIQI